MIVIVLVFLAMCLPAAWAQGFVWRAGFVLFAAVAGGTYMKTEKERTVYLLASLEGIAFFCYLYGY